MGNHDAGRAIVQTALALDGQSEKNRTDRTGKPRHSLLTLPGVRRGV